MKIKQFNQVESTSKTAKELAIRGAEPWTVVCADEQNAGYGKEGRRWYSPKGGLYFSVILPKSNIDDLQTITILAAFIVAKVIKDNFALEPFIKLPNDVWVNQKKVCGILTENIIGKDVKVSVIGIGVNTNIDYFPEQLKNKATSIKIETGQEVDNQMLLRQIIEGLKQQLKTISQ